MTQTDEERHPPQLEAQPKQARLLFKKNPLEQLSHSPANEQFWQLLGHDIHEPFKAKYEPYIQRLQAVAEHYIQLDVTLVQG